MRERAIGMIRPAVLESELPHGPWSCRGCDVWEAIRAAASGDAAALAGLLERDPNLYRAEYWYTQPIRFAVREGHVEAVRILLDASTHRGAQRISPGRLNCALSCSRRVGRSTPTT
jgi:hypothetical protein